MIFCVYTKKNGQEFLILLIKADVESLDEAMNFRERGSTAENATKQFHLFLPCALVGSKPKGFSLGLFCHMPGVSEFVSRATRTQLGTTLKRKRRGQVGELF